jgi:hypothetical protein
MRLFQIIASAQGGRAFVNMGQAFGFSDEVMARMVRYFIPPIAKAVQRRAQTSEGLLSVLEFLGARRYDRFLDDPRIFGHTLVSQEGERILRYLFQREGHVKKLIENRAKVLPLDEQKLERLLPFVAVMVIGGIEARTRRPLGFILQRLTKDAADERSAANPFLAIAQHLRKQERERKERRRGRLFAFLVGGNPAAERGKQSGIAASAALLQAG